MKTKLIILFILLSINIFAVSVQSRRGIMKMIYEGDTMTFQFNGDTNQFTGNLKYFDITGAVTIDSIRFKNSVEWFSSLLTPSNSLDLSGFGEGRVLIEMNDTVGFTNLLYYSSGKFYAPGIQVQSEDTNKIIQAANNGVNLMLADSGQNSLDGELNTLKYLGSTKAWTDNQGFHTNELLIVNYVILPSGDTLNDVIDMGDSNVIIINTIDTICIEGCNDDFNRSIAKGITATDTSNWNAGGIGIINGSGEANKAAVFEDANTITSYTGVSIYPDSLDVVGEIHGDTGTFDNVLQVGGNNVVSTTASGVSGRLGYFNGTSTITGSSALTTNNSNLVLTSAHGIYWGATMYLYGYPPGNYMYMKNGTYETIFGDTAIYDNVSPSFQINRYPTNFNNGSVIYSQSESSKNGLGFYGTDSVFLSLYGLKKLVAYPDGVKMRGDLAVSGNATLGNSATDSAVVNGNLTVTGTLFNEHYEAAAYLHPDSTITTSLSTSWTYLGDGSNNKFTNLYMEGFSFDGDTLQFDQDANDLRDSIEFRIQYSCESATTNVNKTVYNGIFVKNVGGSYKEVIQVTRKARTSSAGVYYVGPMCTSMPMWLKDGDKIQIRAKCAASTTTLSTQSFGVYLYEE